MSIFFFHLQHDVESTYLDKTDFVLYGSVFRKK